MHSLWSKAKEKKTMEKKPQKKAKEKMTRTKMINCFSLDFIHDITK